MTDQPVYAMLGHSTKDVCVGIGKASAIALGKDGWTVVLTARDEAKLKDTASQIEKSHVIAGDLVRSDSFSE